MGFWDKLLSNEVLISAVVGWTVAQVLKTLIDFGLNKSFTPERLVGSGGMPSSHSATVCGLTVASGLCYGVDSFQFAISFILAAVVMYDAIGVRQETGKQAKLLNLIMEQDWFNLNNQEIQQTVKGVCGTHTASGGSRRCIGNHTCTDRTPVLLIIQAADFVFGQCTRTVCVSSAIGSVIQNRLTWNNRVCYHILV